MIIAAKNVLLSQMRSNSVIIDHKKNIILTTHTSKTGDTGRGKRFIVGPKRRSIEQSCAS